MKKVIKVSIVVFVALVIVIQFVPNELPANSEDLSNDLVLMENAPVEIKIILNKACYDCHSNQTNYPWYSQVAPISWLVSKDINEGREELNFSEWGELSKRKKIKILTEMGEVIESKEMPLKVYTIIHRDAVLTDQEIITVSSWTKMISEKVLKH